MYLVTISIVNAMKLNDVSDVKFIISIYIAAGLVYVHKFNNCINSTAITCIK